MTRYHLTGLCALTCLIVAFTISPIAAQDEAIARITLPMRGQAVRGNVTIQGTATSPLFTRFEVAYAPEPDVVNWTIINGSLQPVSNGVLAVWNTRPIPNGKYAIKLQVVNNDGTFVESIVRDLSLTNAAVPGIEAASPGNITSPGEAVTAESLDTEAVTIDLADLPPAFLKGARYALLAFLALGAYVMIKRLLGLVFRKLFKHPINYGR